MTAPYRRRGKCGQNVGKPVESTGYSNREYCHLAAQTSGQAWRWRRDLNPRTVLAVTRFRGVLLRPLGHATAEQLTEPPATHPNRCRAKKASSGAAHSAASTPPRTAGR